jgi:hypothetical protein
MAPPPASGRAKPKKTFFRVKLPKGPKDRKLNYQKEKKESSAYYAYYVKNRPDRLSGS